MSSGKRRRVHREVGRRAGGQPPGLSGKVIYKEHTRCSNTQAPHLPGSTPASLPSVTAHGREEAQGAGLHVVRQDSGFLDPREHGRPPQLPFHAL